MILAGAALAAIALATADTSTAHSLGTLSLHATFGNTPVSEFACPSGTSATTCVTATGKGVVVGLGQATETFTEMLVSSSATCTHTIFGPAVITVAGRGEIDATITDTSQCDAANDQPATDTFTVTGGTGAYAGATGGGQLEFTAFRPTGATSATETHTWSGSVSVAALDFDTSPPTFSGVRNVLVRTKGTHARVHFQVTANDTADGAVTATCTPRTGSTFHLGQTRVTCTATDTSGNTAHTGFTVTVKHARG